MSHTDGSDKYDRRVFGSCPFCALLARLESPGQMYVSIEYPQGVASASSDPYVLFSANTRARSISPMNWGAANPFAFLVDWRIKIGRMDPK